MSVANSPKFPLVLFHVAVIFLVAGCGGTWVDDDGNFKRVFHFAQPKDVKVIHSYYWKSPHWTTEYRYYIELEAPAYFVNNLTHPTFMAPVAVDTIGSYGCLSSKPQWFLPKPAAGYEAWVPKQAGYRIFRDKSDGRLFVCDERL